MLKIGIVGAGAIAGVYAEALKTASRAGLQAVCDIDAAAAERFASVHGVRAYATPLAMVEAEGLDAAIVCTPPSTHAAIAIDLLHRNVHVLCEKPLSVDRAGALAMLEAAKSSGSTLTMGSKFRYAHDVVAAKRFVDSGAIGQVVLFENVFTSYVDMRSRWNSNAALSGGGVLIDNGTHSVDIMRYFLGAVASVHAVEGKRSQGLAVDETVHVFVKNPDDVMGTIDLSWSIQKTTESYIDIYGSEGTISVGWKQSRMRRNGDPEWTVFGNGYDKVQAFRSQIENFAAAIAGEEALVIGPADALASVEVVEAIYHALRRDRWISVPHNADRSRSRVA